MFRVMLACFVLAGATFTAHAQPAASGEYKLTVQPAKEPVPALKYQLAFDLHHQTPGNAAVHYFRAMLVYRDKRDALSTEKRREEMELREKWLSMPLSEWPRAEVRARLDPYKPVYDFIERAARCERCDWKPEVLRQEGFGTLLPEIQQMRLLADLLRYKIRLELAEGQFDQAAHSVRVGFTLAKHIGEGPTLINLLVGIALFAIMDGELMQFMQQPGAPNMYWALTDMPQPLIDMRHGFHGERFSLDGALPGLRQMAGDIRAAPMTAEQIGDLANKLVKLANPKTPEEENAHRLKILNMAGRLHEDAKKMLAEEGRTAEDIERMPMLQAAMLYQLRQYDRAMDDLIKLQSVPYCEAAHRLLDVEAKFKAEAAKTGDTSMSLVGMLVPASHKVRTAHVRIERWHAGLRCVEAVRLYAADHGGKPPAKLDDITDVPIPLDPYTGKPFLYKADGNQAEIEGPAPEGLKPGVDNFVRYIVTIRK